MWSPVFELISRKKAASISFMKAEASSTETYLEASRSDLVPSRKMITSSWAFWCIYSTQFLSSAKERALLME